MGYWSFVSASSFGKLLSSLCHKSSFNAQYRDRALLGIYYLLSFTTNSKELDPNPKYIRLLQRLVNPNTAIVYPLSPEDFQKGLWQSSTRLIVVFDPDCETIRKLQFSLEYDLISQFLADGGHVLLLLNNPSRNHSQMEKTALWRLVTTPNALGDLPMEKFTNLPSWSWRCLDFATQGESHHLLTGGPSQSPTIKLDHRLIAISTNAIDKSNGIVLHEALSLLGISSYNGNTDNETHADVSLESNNLYCLPLASKSQNIVQLIQSTVSHPIAVIDPPFTEQYPLPIGFSWRDYESTLRTRHLGRMLIWAESMDSSWSLGEKLLGNLPPNSGLIVSSNVQTSGKGRGSNLWITPLGQAAFTFHLTADKTLTRFDSVTAFMSHVVCMQHIASLGILLTCKRLICEQLGLLSTSSTALEEEDILHLSYDGPQIRIKWPNDIYVVYSNKYSLETDFTLEHNRLSVLGKLAGVITKASTNVPDKVDILIGCGINVNNPDPTICLSEVIGRCRTTNPAKLSIASVTALFMNQMEHLIDRICSTPLGLAWALRLYTQCWLHSDQIIEVIPRPDEAKKSPYRCRILGLDEFGYLKVQDLQDGSVCSLHPDGNSMDMMRGLVRPK